MSHSREGPGDGSGETALLDHTPPPLCSHSEDRRLALACVAREPDAWARLVERYTSLIVVVARRTLRGRGLNPSDHDLEDICENTFLALIRNDYKVLRSYDDDFALSTLIGVVARTHAGRYVRRKRHPTTSLDNVEPRAPGNDPALAAEQSDLQNAVRQTLERLAPRDREVLQLFYFSNLDYQGIAAAIGLNVNSVGAALHRARSRLRKLLERKGT